MNLPSRLKRSALVFAVVFAALTLVELLKRHPPAAALRFALLWAAVATAIFTATAIYYARRNIACALCNDLSPK